MSQMNDDISNHEMKIEKKLDLIHRDIKKITEESNKKYLEELSESIKDSYLNKIKKHVNNENIESLEKNMVDICSYRRNCKKVFNQYLEKSLKELDPENISSNLLKKYKKELNYLKENAKYEKCDICFDEVSNRFQNQVHLVESLKMYQSDKKKTDSTEIEVDYLVNQILFPIANKQRVEILKSLSLEPRTFSELSKITKLRGGNLIFHIEKLQEKEFIFQKNERGVYLLTKKGFKIMDVLKNLQSNKNQNLKSKKLIKI